MKTNRLKMLNKQIEDIFTEPLGSKINRIATSKESKDTKFEYISCGLC